MDTNWGPHVTVAAIVERQGRFLLVEERVDGALVLNQPAGHLEENESLLQAVRRETLEETGWQFEPSALVGVYLWKHPQKEATYLRFAFTGDVTDWEERDLPDIEIERVRWMNSQQIRGQHLRLRSPQVLKCIDDYLSGQRFPLRCLHDLSDHFPRERAYKSSP